uniref:T-complex protein 1 subunit delta n=1 Tax=Fibrocapsa japonica TaxID=94617 RepID=A0A7S2V5I1_9STRA|mmetsp:Transcript_7573/g.11509  ORF Transcript_7573/g.11509 Transcript_7573/m.11509 type:complete len:533 (+) Transcript_7573:81-1679(+)|eukprot:CAMPEP_0113935694 /NCGR_PEP_ID=MMETSP1339-20121228/2794_1 /TAXON_ID=94617 /ORGANISM="Fibrocapsa japonica" /LENGTH=532 /DNA_ID=CAMNT_0000937931 /DNA_START=22 /DNA_END=1620 /DNA_ORIENTATION=- /assembly_acc=CAM_ASM_000762
MALGETHKDSLKEKDVRLSNITAAKAVSSAIRTSLGPRGMDKMIEKGDGEVMITNDGATILSEMQVFHPTAKMLVEISKAQDIEAGDGTTSVCVLAGSLLNAAGGLLEKGIHPMAITDAFIAARTKSSEILRSMAQPVDLNQKPALLDAVTTCLSSKVVSQNSETLAPMAVDAVLGLLGEDPMQATNVDLRDVRIVKQVGGTVDDSELVRGVVLEKGAKKTAGGPTRIENAKIGLIQFHLSAPKTDMENNVVISDYAAMDRLLREERKIILQLCKKIKKSGCNVVLIQKSILRDAYNDLSLHFLAKMGIMAITDIERNDVEFLSKTLGCLPVAHVDSFTADKLGSAELVQEVGLPGTEGVGGGTKVVKFTGVANPDASVCILLRGSNKLVLDEADRSVHDALCVMRSLVKEKFMIAGGGAPETEVAVRLMEWSKTQTGMKAYCIRAFAEAMEVIPYTLAENAGLNPITLVTELRKKHNEDESGAGLNVRKSIISDMYKEHVIQPLLVSTSAVGLASECVNMILKIDDLVVVR